MVPGSNGLQFVFHGAYMFLWTSTDKLYRAIKDDFANWIDVSPPVPAGTTGRPDICVSNGTYLFYGNYNGSNPGEAHVWRSANNGDTWVEVFNVPTARHVHAIYVDPDDATHVFVMCGDAAFAGFGLYYSSDSGATFTRIASNTYGINMRKVPESPGYPARLMCEGDQANVWLTGFDLRLLSSGGDLITAVPAAGGEWSGTSRAIHLTSEGNLFFFSTSEGYMGTKSGAWLSHGPAFNSAVLLEDASDGSWGYAGRVFELGEYLYNNTHRITRPRFQGQ